LKAQLQTSNIELALVNAESNLKLSNVSLNLMMGLPEKTKLIPDSGSLKTETDLKSIDEYEQTAFQNRKDVEALNVRMKAANTSVKSAKGDYYPSLAVTGGYMAADIPGFLTVTNAFNIGLGVQYNLGSLWKTSGKIGEAKARQKEIEASRDLLSDNIKMELNKAYEDYFSAKKKADVGKFAVINATENYRITKNKYDNNLVTTTELLDANVALLEAKINLETAKADIIAAYNTLLEKAGILTDNQPGK
jgi:outer membrane protein TolC